MSDLRDLADVLRKAVENHPAYGQGASIIINCCDHLTVTAAFHEANQRTSAAQAELDRLKKNCNCAIGAWGYCPHRGKL